VAIFDNVALFNNVIHKEFAVFQKFKFLKKYFKKENEQDFPRPKFTVKYTNN
jgi:hypothetical protein